jgi:hypothetical protein
VPNPRYDVVVWTWKDGQKVLGDVLHGFQVPTARMDEIRQAATDEAVRTHAVVRSNIDQADEALARRRANMYGGEPEYPDKGGAAPAAAGAGYRSRSRPAAAPAAPPPVAAAPAPQPTGPLNESGLPSNVPQRSAPGSTVIKSLAAPKSANAEKPPLVSPRLQDRPGSTHIEDRRDEQLFPHRQGVDIWTVEPAQRPDIIRGWIASENKVIARFGGDVRGNAVVEQAKLQRDYYQQLLDGLEAAFAKDKGSKK